MTAPAASIADHLDWLFGRLNYERLSPGNYSLGDFKLDRMRELLDALGNPQNGRPCVHVAGSKGKGSVVHLVDAAVRGCGYRVGRFTSPHIERFHERIAIDGEPIADDALAAAFDRVRPVVEHLDAGDGPKLTFFEIGTALGWVAFEQAACELVVLEVGLGGRLDSTNVCDPLVTAIVSISHDHGQLLGDGLDEIAAEKAGIIKPGVPVVTGPLPPEAAEVVTAIADEHDAPLWSVGRAIGVRRERTGSDAPEHGGPVTIFTPDEDITVPVVLPGTHQRDNLVVAVGVLMKLRKWKYELPSSAIAAALATVSLPLRAEVVRQSPLIVLDVAHNGASVAALLATVPALRGPNQDGRLFAIFGTSSDKHVDEMLAEMRGRFDRVFLTEYSTNPRALRLAELEALASRLLDCPTTVTATPAASLAAAIACLTDPGDALLIFGSFFLASEMQSLLRTGRSADSSPLETFGEQTFGAAAGGNG